jgi:hypothetical protein
MVLEVASMAGVGTWKMVSFGSSAAHGDVFISGIEKKHEKRHSGMRTT